MVPAAVPEQRPESSSAGADLADEDDEAQEIAEEAYVERDAAGRAQEASTPPPPAVDPRDEPEAPPELQEGSPSVPGHQAAPSPEEDAVVRSASAEDSGPPAGSTADRTPPPEPEDEDIWELDDAPKVSTPEGARPQPSPPRVVVIEEDPVPMANQGASGPGNIGATLREEPRKRRFRLFRKGGE